jgi:hypothetical protein
MSDNKKLEAIRELRYVLSEIRECKKPNGDFDYSVQSQIDIIVSNIARLSAKITDEALGIT